MCYCFQAFQTKGCPPWPSSAGCLPPTKLCRAVCCGLQIRTSRHRCISRPPWTGSSHCRWSHSATATLKHPKEIAINCLPVHHNTYTSWPCTSTPFRASAVPAEVVSGQQQQQGSNSQPCINPSTADLRHCIRQYTMVGAVPLLKASMPLQAPGWHQYAAECSAQSSR